MSKRRPCSRSAHLRSKAIHDFADWQNHAAHNSAFKTRTASQRPMPPPTPMRNGSPRGKATEESFLQRTSLKGKGGDDNPIQAYVSGKAFAPPSVPRFGGLNNAFAQSPSTPRVKVKRQRLESVMPFDRSPTKGSSPMASPIKKRSVDDQAGPSSPSPAPPDVNGLTDDVDMELGADQPESAAILEPPGDMFALEPADIKAEVSRGRDATPFFVHCLLTWLARGAARPCSARPYPHSSLARLLTDSCCITYSIISHRACSKKHMIPTPSTKLSCIEYSITDRHTSWTEMEDMLGIAVSSCRPVAMRTRRLRRY